MTRLPDTTADAVVGVVEAVIAGRGASTGQQVADFVDLPLAKAESALDLAEDLGLVRPNALGGFEACSPLARLMTTPLLQQRAALLRVAVEAYEPFRTFRERLHLGGESVAVAAQQTCALLQLTEHREVVKETLVSLGTYSQCLRSTGGGQYEVRFELEDQLIGRLKDAVAELGEAELRLRDWLSEGARTYVDPASVLDPLSEAYLKVSEGDSRGAVVNAGNAVESYLAQLAGDQGVNVAGAHGIGAKVDRFDQATMLPKKLVAVGKYLSNVRNAADHGIDSDVGAAWTVRDGTGEDYLRVAITFIESSLNHKNGGAPSL